MADINPNIEVIVLMHRISGKTQVVYVSPSCGGDVPGELWVEQTGSNWFIYQQDEFYDDTLRKRRNAMNMFSPIKSEFRLGLVGPVSGSALFESTDYIEISKGTFSLD